MLRQRLSSGALRATALVHATLPPAVPLLPARFAPEGARGLASAVLLESRENWSSRTVKDLKGALVKRGLPQTGNKSTLINRLQAYEQTQTSSSSTSSRSQSNPAKPTSKPAQARSVSTSSPAAAPTPSAPAPAPEPAKPKPAPTPPASKDTLVPPEVKVDNKNVGAVEHVEESVAPGLPESGGKEKGVGAEMAVSVPTYELVEEQMAVPPYTPDNFTSSASNSMSPPTPAPTSGPKVMTVSSSATHPDAPSHGLHETHDSHGHDLAEEAQELAELAKTKVADLPSLGDAFKGIKVPSLGLSSISGLLAAPTGEPSGEFKVIERGLDGEEKTGAYWLAGIVVAGLLLGGPSSSKKEKHGGKHEKHAEDGKKKGGAEYDFKTGAGIVGHGARKD